MTLRDSVLVIMVVIVGCAPHTRPIAIDETLVAKEAKIQREIALRSLIEKQRRLSQLGYPLMKAAVPLCEDDVDAAIGITFANQYSFREAYRPAAAALYGLGDRLTVMQVIPGSASAAAGLQQGDVLVTIEGKPIPVGNGAVRALHGMIDQMASEGRLPDFKNPFDLSVLRDGVRHTVTLTADRVCAYPVILGEDDGVNAFADGSRVVVAKGMLRFADNDEELSMVIAHELAHNAMAHIRAKTTNYLLGSVFDIIAGVYGVNTGGFFGQAASRVYSQRFETEADYVGLYIMARAGLNIDNTAYFWRRMAAENPATISSDYTSTHPATPERFVAIEHTVQEIRRKQRSGTPLLPDYDD